MKMYGEVDVQIHVFSTSVLVAEWSASRPGRFTLRERAFGTHWIGGWVGPRTGLDDVEKRNNKNNNNNLKLRGFSPQANYSDRATVSCRLS
jgi:hypothetical protein